mmetsp:Transcript_3760/g.10927  ORF Transcript_3760/g.10927 Transcript_3760/m.10927 type:complete len:320 (-) Transcript_3760:325-1284(-)
MQQQQQRNYDSVRAFAAIGGDGASGTARILGSGCAGVTELFLFHPTDTIAKRLMSNTKTVYVGGDMKATMANANQVIFRDAANGSAFTKFKSMFPGFGFAAGYKILQRTYKFGGQPFVKDYINKNHGPSLKESFGPKIGSVLASGTAGAMMGVGEIALLPLDVLKIKAQTNPDALKGRGVMEIFMNEGRGLYRGAGWTAARNAPGSFALFGGSALMHHGVFGLENTKEATFAQNFAASIVGAVASITVAAPLDVIKTRVQNRPFDAPESGVQIVRNLIRDEGPTAFFKGLTPKIMVVGPKLIFSYTVAMTMINWFNERL